MRKWVLAGGSMNATRFSEGDLEVAIKIHNVHIFRLSKTYLNGNYPIKTKRWFMMIYV